MTSCMAVGHFFIQHLVTLFPYVTEEVVATDLIWVTKKRFVFEFWRQKFVPSVDRQCDQMVK